MFTRPQLRMRVPLSMCTVSVRRRTLDDGFLTLFRRHVLQGLAELGRNRLLLDRDLNRKTQPDDP